MSGLVRPARGMTYYDANRHRFITEAPDVCDFKTRIRELAPGVLDVYFDSEQEEWIVTQKNGDVETFLLADTDLGRAYERVQRADNERPGAESAEQFLSRVEREEEAAKKKDMEGFKEIAGDAAERLAFALKKDGIHDHENIYGPKARPHLARRDVRTR